MHRVLGSVPRNKNAKRKRRREEREGEEAGEGEEKGEGGTAVGKECESADT